MSEGAGKYSGMSEGAGKYTVQALVLEGAYGAEKFAVTPMCQCFGMEGENGDTEQNV